MAHKYSQRRTSADLALQLGLDPAEVEEELDLLRQLEYVRTWPDGSWTLTSLGNMRRNRLTTS
jgi:Mn-dependent DtxR family transcriptional regulator